MQARIHQVKTPDDLFQKPDAWLKWTGPGQDELVSAIEALGPRKDALLHLDYHPLNVMTDGSQVTAVLDWANALAGDPRADLARTFTILRVLPSEPGSPPLVMTIFRYTFSRAWRTGYKQVAGPCHDLGLFYVWAGTVMVRDLAPKVGRPGIWLQKHHLDQVQSWTDRWRRRMGLSVGP
jgi:aminoglycoside phosphotransferase (APT) family kinase protein